MKTLTLDDKLYTALEEEAIKVGRPVGELLTEAVEQWLLDAELDESELGEIESADREWRKHGGVEASEFFATVRKERGWD
ncbi:MAG: ribbon-helix-helix protein, CopG family [Dehalococcoidia bacterium]|nr:ribbon-helix-helix protein, CopG family [Dehalococcoidia bacterium]